MNICTPYVNDFPYNDKVQEFTISYKEEADSYEQLVNFVSAFPDKRINIELLEGEIKDIESLLDINPYIHIKLPAYQMDWISSFQERGIPYFSNIQAINWDILNSLIEAKVSDVYIGDELGFNLPLIKHKLDLYGVNSRVIVNLAQTTDPCGTNSKIRSFFIRPEDLDFYANYIDTFEFFHMDSQTKLEVLYKIYLIDKTWFGDLEEIIADLNVSINNKSLLPDFAVHRGDCGKRCYKNSNCSLCDRIVKLADAFAEKGVMFQ